MKIYRIAYEEKYAGTWMESSMRVATSKDAQVAVEKCKHRVLKGDGVSGFRLYSVHLLAETS